MYVSPNSTTPLLSHWPHQISLNHSYAHNNCTYSVFPRPVWSGATLLLSLSFVVVKNATKLLIFLFYIVLQRTLHNYV